MMLRECGEGINSVRGARLASRDHTVGLRADIAR